MQDPSDLPAALPVFPLVGVVLLPGNLLPLHVFEPRYRAMTEDVLAGDRILGIIQPRETLDAEAGDPANPPLQTVGCVGRIVRHRPLKGGRCLIVLRGLQRFAVRGELTPLRGYRRVEPDYAAYAHDRDEPGDGLDPSSLHEALARLEARQGVKVEHNKLRELDGVGLLNLLAAALPFGPLEKQALLEAATPAERHEILLALLEMGFDLRDEAGPEAPRLAN